eukprot:7378618-Prymnesium_polylepis.2
MRSGQGRESHVALQGQPQNGDQADLDLAKGLDHVDDEDHHARDDGESSPETKHHATEDQARELFIFQSREAMPHHANARKCSSRSEPNDSNARNSRDIEGSERQA